MVVASPIPSMPSLQRRRRITSVCCCMVCIASLCGRMVGRSTMIDSRLWIRGLSMFQLPGIGVHRVCVLPGLSAGKGLRGTCTPRRPDRGLALQCARPQAALFVGCVASLLQLEAELDFGEPAAHAALGALGSVIDE